MDDLMGEYLDALEPFLRDPEMREGQAYFNALGRSFGHLTADVVGTERDCFTVDRNLPAFLGWLEKALKREAVRRRWVRDGEMTDVFWAAVDAVNWRGHDVPGPCGRWPEESKGLTTGSSTLWRISIPGPCTRCWHPRCLT
nr:hypothetical protein GCM10017745_04820 [Saccharothrix mutabilis subsp. capreolus]